MTMSVTALLSDIRGFTSMSARLEPDEMVEFLNACLSAMIGAFYREGGTVLKLIGDAVVAVVGAPAKGNCVVATSRRQVR